MMARLSRLSEVKKHLGSLPKRAFGFCNGHLLDALFLLEVTKIANQTTKANRSLL